MASNFEAFPLPITKPSPAQRGSGLSLIRFSAPAEKAKRREKIMENALKKSKLRSFSLLYQKVRVCNTVFL